jgi:hypothetical protein
MWFISADGLTSCRGSMPCMWEGLIRWFIFKVRLSGPFECLFCRYFRLIIGIWEWRHDLQIANMLLLRNPRGTCRCGQKNDWLCIGQHLGFLWWVRSPPHRTETPTGGEWGKILNNSTITLFSWYIIKGMRINNPTCNPNRISINCLVDFDTFSLRTSFCCLYLFWNFLFFGPSQLHNCFVLPRGKIQQK